MLETRTRHLEGKRNGDFFVHLREIENRESYSEYSTLRESESIRSIALTRLHSSSVRIRWYTWSTEEHMEQKTRSDTELLSFSDESFPSAIKRQSMQEHKQNE